MLLTLHRQRRTSEETIGEETTGEGDLAVDLSRRNAPAMLARHDRLRPSIDSHDCGNQRFFLAFGCSLVG